MEENRVASQDLSSTIGIDELGREIPSSATATYGYRAALAVVSVV